MNKYTAMARILLSKSLSLYLKNFKASLVFAILLVFVLVFASFQNLFVSSGTIFFSYSLSEFEAASLLLPLAGFLAFMLFYSFFLTVIIFSVRKELSKVKLSYYLTEAIRKFSFKMLIFFAVFSIAMYLLQLVFLYAGVPILVSAIITFLITTIFLFVPQAIVVDEQPLVASVQNGFDFVKSNKRDVFLVIVVGAVLLALLQLVEFALDSLFLLGNYFSLIVVLVVVLPFVETLKTYLYMVDKFDLIGKQEMKSA
jgi:hypothetical protein